MIIRIVKMEFEQAHVADFLTIFAASKDKIQSFPGCRHLRLLQDETDSSVFFTYSHWDSHVELDRYRKSELFQTVWGETKKLFRGNAQAWSLTDKTAPMAG